MDRRGLERRCCRRERRREFAVSAVLPVGQPVCLEPLVIAGLRAEARDGEWWLLDSGAGVTVLSLKYAEMFGVYVDDLKRQRVGQQFSAANGSSVRMLGERTISVELLLENGNGESTWHAADMNVWVGDTNHNIISTTMLCFRSWSFSQNCAGIALATSAGLTAKEVTLFGDVPWLRLKPLLKPSHGSSNEVELSLSSISAEGGVLVAPVTCSTQVELAQHRLQGHTPYHPGCSDRFMHLQDWRRLLQPSPCWNLPAVRVEDSAGLRSTAAWLQPQAPDRLAKLRDRWSRRLFDNKLCLRLAQSLQHSPDQPPLCEAELAPFVQDAVDVLGISESDRSAVLSITPGQPLRLRLLQALLVCLGDSEAAMCDELQTGVRIGVGVDIKPSDHWPPRDWAPIIPDLKVRDCARGPGCQRRLIRFK